MKGNEVTKGNREELGIFLGASAGGARPALLCAGGHLLRLVAVEFVGIVLGIVGYVLGAQRLGSLTVVLCTAAMILGLLVAQGVMAGAYDQMVEGVFR